MYEWYVCYMYEIFRILSVFSKECFELYFYNEMIILDCLFGFYLEKC